jgi:hypothetical protein
MSTTLVRRLTNVGAILLLLAVGGCGSTSADDHDPGVTAPSSSTVRASSTARSASTVTSTSTAPTTVPEELTAEEQLRVNPPPPQRLSATRNGAAVTLTWSPPLPVAVPHTYSDTVVEYRVYRSLDGGAEVLVGTSTTLTFTDARPGAGTPRYAVSSVREHGVEGPRTDAVAPPAS